MKKEKDSVKIKLYFFAFLKIFRNGNDSKTNQKKIIRNKRNSEIKVTKLGIWKTWKKSLLENVTR